jgi:hypothetical protein
VVIASDGLLFEFDPDSPVVDRPIEPRASTSLEFLVMSKFGTRVASVLFTFVMLISSAQTQPATGAS